MKSRLKEEDVAFKVNFEKACDYVDEISWITLFANESQS